MKKKGFTLIELLVVIAIIAMLLAILMPALNKVKKIAARVVCGTNLKGLGTAQTLYASDNDDEYVVQGRGLAHTWGTASAFQNQTTNVTNTAGTITVGASLYMLVREADVSPKSFVCPASSETVFSGKNSFNLDIVSLYDFGHPTATALTLAEGPGRCVSYSYHMPYVGGTALSGAKGRHATTGSRSASFATMADKNPFYDSKLTKGGPTADNWIDRVTLINLNDAVTDWDSIERWKVQVANTQPHDRDGQNVLFADGHTSYETRSDVGVKNDNIYTPWSGTGTNTTETDRRKGLYLGTPMTLSVPVGSEDSIMVNDLVP